MCFVHFVGLCSWIHCVSYIKVLPDIVALLGTFSRLELPYGTSLSTWKKAWKRAPKVTSGCFSARQDASRCGQDAKLPRQDASCHGQDVSRHGQDISRCGQDVGGSQSRLAHLLEVSFRQ